MRRSFTVYKNTANSDGMWWEEEKKSSGMEWNEMKKRT